jgi:hypothetical protein
MATILAVDGYVLPFRQKPVDNTEFLKAIEGALAKVGRPA